MNGNMNTKQNYSQYFEISTRPTSDERFWKCKDNAPKELRELIHEIHKELWCGLPNDWIYEIIYRAFEDLEETEMEQIQIEADIYNSELLKWLENSFADEFCSAVLLASCLGSIWTVISAAQYEAKFQIYLMVDSFMESNEQKTEEQ